MSASRTCWHLVPILGLAQHRPLAAVQLLNHVFATPWTAACHASLSFTISRSLMKPMSIESVIPSNHLILCCPLLLLPSIFPSTAVFSNELALHIRWPKYWGFSLSVNPSSEFSGLISFRMDWFDLNCPIHLRRNHTRSLQSLV